MTLIELTVVIAVLLLLIGIMFMGASAWKNGSDRSSCIMNQYRVQVAMRSFANINQLKIGDDTTSLVPPVSLEQALTDAGFVEDYPTCPSNGIYDRSSNLIPDVGNLFMTCSLSTTREHVPMDYAGW